MRQGKVRSDETGSDRVSWVRVRPGQMRQGQVRSVEAGTGQVR